MKKLYICNDSFGSRINVGDTVELFIGFETKTPWKSKVYWNMLDGAFVDSHPGHKKMGLGSGYRDLSYFIRNEDVKIENEEGEIEVLRVYVKKIKNTGVAERLRQQSPKL